MPLLAENGDSYGIGDLEEGLDILADEEFGDLLATEAQRHDNDASRNLEGAFGDLVVADEDDGAGER